MSFSGVCDNVREYGKCHLSDNLIRVFRCKQYLHHREPRASRDLECVFNEQHV